VRKLAAVQEARAVMNEGMDWSAWKWLLESRRVRETADAATAALNAADRKVKSTWPADLKIAYSELLTTGAKRKNGSNHGDEVTPTIAAEIRALAKQVKDADDKAERCRLAAEEKFDEAERRFSSDLAREGATKALETYDLREAAIRKAEAAGRQITAAHQGQNAIHV